MKLGLKIGPENNWKDRIDRAHPDMVEIWFDVNRLDEYQDIFAYVKAQNIDAGLHFWGALAGGISTNLAYPDDHIIQETMRLIKKTIDVAHQWEFAYVNIHPGSRANLAIDFDKGTLRVVAGPVAGDLSDNLFIKKVQELDAYARQKNVVLTVETVPPRVGANWLDAGSRTRAFDIYQPPVSTIEKAARAGVWVANDFVHSAANSVTADAHVVWDFLYTTTKTLAPQTRLIHLGFLIPPYNGTDIHDSLDNPVFQTDDAIPNKKQMIELLQLFKNRHDIWALVEPKNDHVKNYFLAQKILADAGVLS